MGADADRERIGQHSTDAHPDDRGTEYCGAADRHPYEHLAVEDIDHTRTRTKRPQINGICERFHKTMLNEFYCVAFRQTIDRDVVALQAVLDRFVDEYNQCQSHQGRWCYGKTPMQTFLDTLSTALEKLIPDGQERVSTPPGSRGGAGCERC